MSLRCAVVLIFGLFLCRSASGQLPAEKALPKAEANSGAVALPSDHGQVWREYDLSAYTSKIKTTERPEQAVVDWILRETGTEVWFSAPLGLMSADRRALKVYHTPEMHRVVEDVVNRFTAGDGQAHLLGLRLVTVASPNWRGKGHTLLRPVSVQSAGVEAWLTSKENAALLFAELKKRPDFREHNSPHVAIQNGQSQTVARTRPRTYMRAAVVQDLTRPGGLTEQAQIDEGFSLQLSPLFSADGKTVDAVIKCQVDQVERFLPVLLESPSTPGTGPRAQIQVPVLVSWRLHERFRWPADQVIVLSCGVVAPPADEKASPLAALGGSPRADALLFIECLGKADAALAEPARSAGGTENRGRY
jgi:hypothetical protein